MQTIDLVALRDFTRETGQPTHPELLDTTPMQQVKEIEIDEEHITITYNQETTHYYNANEIKEREWVYKYNDDPEMVAAIAKVIGVARKHVRDLPENVACPPGCAQCCHGYEPFVSKVDVQRIADHLGMSYGAVMKEYVVERKSADGFNVGWLRKITEDINDKCVFLMGNRSGKFYCGIYEGRPHDCRAFTPVGCEDVDETLPRDVAWKVGAPFKPLHRAAVRPSRRR